MFFYRKTQSVRTRRIQPETGVVSARTKVVSAWLKVVSAWLKVVSAWLKVVSAWFKVVSAIFCDSDHFIKQTIFSFIENTMLFNTSNNSHTLTIHA